MSLGSSHAAKPSQSSGDMQEESLHAPDRREIPRLDIFGLPVVAARSGEARFLIDGRFAAGDPFGVAFLNAHGSNVAAGDAEFRQALQKQLLLNDGIGVDIAARILNGRSFPENLNGTDFVPAYLEHTHHDHRVFLLGAKPGMAERARDALAGIAPRHDYVGVRHGYFGASETADVVADIRRSGATTLLVALGNPSQELWIDRHLEATGVRVAFGVGALFDFLAGEVPRAPEALRRAGMEWAFRLSLEPKRLFRRYVVGNPRFLARVAHQRLKRR